MELSDSELLEDSVPVRRSTAKKAALAVAAVAWMEDFHGASQGLGWPPFWGSLNICFTSPSHISMGVIFPYHIDDEFGGFHAQMRAPWCWNIYIPGGHK